MFVFRYLFSNNRLSRILNPSGVVYVMYLYRSIHFTPYPSFFISSMNRFFDLLLATAKSMAFISRSFLLLPRIAAWYSLPFMVRCFGF